MESVVIGYERNAAIAFCKYSTPLETKGSDIPNFE